MSSQADSVARLLSLAADKSAHFVTHLHPAWAQSMWHGAAVWLASLDDAAARNRASTALRAVCGVEWPSLGALAHHLNRAALLPRQATVAWLCAAALFLRRREVRRCVGRTQRQALIEMVGPHALNAIVAAPDSGVAPWKPPPLDGESAQTLAVWAFEVLSAQQAWSCPNARRLIGWGLPPAASGVRPEGGAQPQQQPQQQPPQVLPLGGFVDRLADYFPGYSWLFGSDMDRALSA